jgi:hypothetical protein
MAEEASVHAGPPLGISDLNALFTEIYESANGRIKHSFDVSDNCVQRRVQEME